MKILITGGTNGMGKGVAKILAGLDDYNTEIIILCRSEKLGMETINEIESTTSNKKLSIVLCDLTKLSDVKGAVEEIQSKHDFLDCIFINAGIGYASKRIETENGMDSHFQVNYLSQFMLTLNLLNLLENSENAGKIIFNVTTVKDKIHWDDIQMKNSWGFEKGIHQAMVAKRMFLNKLHKLHRNKKDSKLSFMARLNQSSHNLFRFKLDI
jgi:NAD(P)-dependent dehydrogenase (short-subunit alcohol dehydrogenase family)